MAPPTAASLITLPEEIFDPIIADVCRQQYKHALLATVCRRFKLAIECHTFGELTVYSTELDRLWEIVSTSPQHAYRRSAIRVIKLSILLPLFSLKVRVRMENIKEKRENDKVFTEAIRRIMGIVKAWDDVDIGAPRRSTPRSLNLEIDAFSPMDVGRDSRFYPGYRKIPRAVHWDVGDRPRDLSQECRYYRSRHSRLRLICPTSGLQRRVEGLDENINLLSVTELTINGAGARERGWGVNSALAVIHSMPEIRTLTLSLDDNEWRYPNLRRNERYAIAQGLENLTTRLPFLTNFTFSFRVDTPTDHSFRIPSALHPSSPPKDHLSIALHKLSQCPTLTSLTLRGGIVVSPDLFWPQHNDDAKPASSRGRNGSNISSDQSNSRTTPFWPALRQVSIALTPITPFGEWFYEKDSIYSDGLHCLIDSPDSLSEYSEYADSDQEELTIDIGDVAPLPPSFSDEEKQEELKSIDLDCREIRVCGQARNRRYRSKLSPTIFNPILTALARSITRMPNLELLRFKLTGSSPFRLHWFRKGVMYSHFGRQDVHTCVVQWWAEHRWEMPEEVRELLQEGVDRGDGAGGNQEKGVVREIISRINWYT